MQVMNQALTSSELKHLENFVTTCLADPGSFSHEELVEAISENQELCARAVQQARASRPGEITEADINFLQSWLKARNLILGGLQLLQMADPGNAAAIQHELECTETAFTLLPGLLAEAKQRISPSP